VTLTNALLWNKIKNFDLDSSASSLNFSHRLALETGWSRSYCHSVIAEYKAFIYLTVIANHPVTPPPDIDDVWHLHMIYSRNYWDEFCANVVGEMVYHAPSTGGSLEQEKFGEWCGNTKSLYVREFSTPPPKKIWADSAENFDSKIVRKINV
jgi:hypothetical protein